MSISIIQQCRQFSIAGALAQELNSWSKQTDVQSEKVLVEIGARAGGLLLTPLAALVDVVAHTVFSVAFAIFGLGFLLVQAVVYPFKAEESVPFFKEMFLTSACIEVGRVVQFIALLAFSPLVALSSPRFVKHLSQDFLLAQSNKKIQMLQLDRQNEELEKSQKIFQAFDELVEMAENFSPDDLLKLNQMIEEKDEQIKSLQEKISEKDVLIQVWENELKDSDSLSEGMVKQLQESRDEIEGLKAEIDELKTKILNLKRKRLKQETDDLKRKTDEIFFPEPKQQETLPKKTVTLDSSDDETQKDFSIGMFDSQDSDLD